MLGLFSPGHKCRPLWCATVAGSELSAPLQRGCVNAHARLVSMHALIQPHAHIRWAHGNTAHGAGGVCRAQWMRTRAAASASARAWPSWPPMPLPAHAVIAVSMAITAARALSSAALAAAAAASAASASVHAASAAKMARPSSCEMHGMQSAAEDIRPAEDHSSGHCWSLATCAQQQAGGCACNAPW